MSEEDIKKIEEKVFNHKLYFDRVPGKEWTWFKNYAREEWSNDYGVALAAIIKGVMPPDYELFQKIIELNDKVKQLDLKIMLLEQGNNKIDTKVIKTVSGKILNR